MGDDSLVKIPSVITIITESNFPGSYREYKLTCGLLVNIGTLRRAICHRLKTDHRIMIMTEDIYFKKIKKNSEDHISFFVNDQELAHEIIPDYDLVAKFYPLTVGGPVSNENDIEERFKKLKLENKKQPENVATPVKKEYAYMAEICEHDKIDRNHTKYIYFSKYDKVSDVIEMYNKACQVSLDRKVRLRIDHVYLNPDDKMCDVMPTNKPCLLVAYPSTDDKK